MGQAIDRIAILSEDTYGKLFLKKLVERINVGYKVIVDRFVGVCNTKSTRQVKAKLELACVDRVIIVVDADCGPEDEVYRRVICHIPRNLRHRVKIVIVKTEIEEWICRSLGIKHGCKPSDDLNKYVQRKYGRKYTKSMLPSFADKIDIEKLAENSASFTELLVELEKLYPS